MEHHHHEHEQHEHDHGEMYGMAVGFRIVEDAGKLFLAEAEISPYTDAPEELGVTLVFHPLEGINPVEQTEDEDWPAWTLDIDDELKRDTTADIPAQFQAIMRQLYELTETDLRGFLRLAQEEGGEEE